MDSRSILLALLLVGISLINYAVLRDMIYGIFLGNKSKKSADKIIAEQNGFAKFTQSFMTQYIVKHQVAFQKWMRFKQFHFLFTVVQLIAFVVLIVLNIQFWIIAIICGVLAIYNTVIFMLMMKQTATSDNKKTRKGSPWTFEQ